MTFDRLYPNAHLLQQVLPDVHKSDHHEPCWACGVDTAFITYRYPRPAVSVCSLDCIQKLDAIAKEPPCQNDA